METITNAASSVGSTVSNLIYGQPAKDNETTGNETTGNETAGKEPLSGQQGKGTLNDPFDQGNAEKPVDTSSNTNTLPDRSKDVPASGNTTAKDDDFLKLSPAVGKPTTTESTDTKTGGTGESLIPIVPLNPDAATRGGDKTDTTSSSAAGITDKAGVTDQTWEPTALDEVKPEGAPGAGPSAPEFTPATPDLTSSTSNKASESTGTEIAKDSAPEFTPATPNLTSSTSNKASESTGTEIAKDSAPSETAGSSAQQKGSVGGDIDAILESTPKSKHNVDDREAEDPHSKMSGTTVRQTEASKHGESDGAKSLATEKAGTKPESSGSADPASPGDNDEKSRKMSHFKDKLKDKLHIGSKDK